MVTEKCNLCKLMQQSCMCPDVGQISSGADMEVDQCSANVESSCDNLVSDGAPSGHSTSPKSSNENCKDSNCLKSKTDDTNKSASMSSDFEIIDEDICTDSSNIPTKGSYTENKASPDFSGSRDDDNVAQLLVKIKKFDFTNNIGSASQINMLKLKNDLSKASNFSDVEKGDHSKPPSDLTNALDKDEQQLSEVGKQSTNDQSKAFNLPNIDKDDHSKPSQNLTNAADMDEKMLSEVITQSANDQGKAFNHSNINKDNHFKSPTKFSNRMDKDEQQLSEIREQVMSDPSKGFNFFDIEKDDHSRPPSDLSNAVDKDEQQLSEVGKQYTNDQSKAFNLPNIDKEDHSKSSHDLTNAVDMDEKMLSEVITQSANDQGKAFNHSNINKDNHFKPPTKVSNPMDKDEQQLSEIQKQVMKNLRELFNLSNVDRGDHSKFPTGLTNGTDKDEKQLSELQKQVMSDLSKIFNSFNVDKGDHSIHPSDLSNAVDKDEKQLSDILNQFMNNQCKAPDLSNIEKGELSRPQSDLTHTVDKDEKGRSEVGKQSSNDQNGSINLPYIDKGDFSKPKTDLTNATDKDEQQLSEIGKQSTNDQSKSFNLPDVNKDIHFISPTNFSNAMDKDEQQLSDILKQFMNNQGKNFNLPNNDNGDHSKPPSDLINAVNKDEQQLSGIRKQFMNNPSELFNHINIGLALDKGGHSNPPSELTHAVDKDVKYLSNVGKQCPNDQSKSFNLPNIDKGDYFKPPSNLPKATDKDEQQLSEIGIQSTNDQSKSFNLPDINKDIHYKPPTSLSNAVDKDEQQLSDILKQFMNNQGKNFNLPNNDNGDHSKPPSDLINAVNKDEQQLSGIRKQFMNNPSELFNLINIGLALDKGGHSNPPSELTHAVDKDVKYLSNVGTQCPNDQSKSFNLPNIDKSDYFKPPSNLPKATDKDEQQLSEIGIQSTNDQSKSFNLPDINKDIHFKPPTSLSNAVDKDEQQLSDILKQLMKNLSKDFNLPNNDKGDHSKPPSDLINAVNKDEQQLSGIRKQFMNNLSELFNLTNVEKGYHSKPPTDLTNAMDKDEKYLSNVGKQSPNDQSESFNLPNIDKGDYFKPSSDLPKAMDKDEKQLSEVRKQSTNDQSKTFNSFNVDKGGHSKPPSDLTNAVKKNEKQLSEIQKCFMSNLCNAFNISDIDKGDHSQSPSVLTPAMDKGAKQLSEVEKQSKNNQCEAFNLSDIHKGDHSKPQSDLTHAVDKDEKQLSEIQKQAISDLCKAFNLLDIAKGDHSIPPSDLTKAMDKDEKQFFEVGKQSTDDRSKAFNLSDIGNGEYSKSLSNTTNAMDKDEKQLFEVEKQSTNDQSKAFNHPNIFKGDHAKPPSDLINDVDKEEQQLSEIQKQLMDTLSKAINLVNIYKGNHSKPLSNLTHAEDKDEKQLSEVGKHSTNDQSKSFNLPAINKDDHSKPSPVFTNDVDKCEKQLSEMETQLMNYETPAAGLSNNVFGCFSKVNDSSVIPAHNECDKLAVIIGSQNTPTMAVKLLLGMQSSDVTVNEDKSDMTTSYHSRKVMSHSDTVRNINPSSSDVYRYNLRDRGHKSELRPNVNPSEFNPNMLVAEKECIHVHFAVLVAPDFFYDPNHQDIFILFGHSLLGDWECRYKMTCVGSYNDQFHVLALNVDIPVEITYQTLNYKYCAVTKDQKSYDYEMLHYSRNQGENRRLDINNIQKCNQTYYRFDNCIEPYQLEQTKSLITFFKNKIKSFLLRNTSNLFVFQRINADTGLAFFCFLPRFLKESGYNFTIFYDPLTLKDERKILNIKETMELMDSLLFCFSSLFYSDYYVSDKMFVCHLARDVLCEYLSIPENTKLSNAKCVEFGCVVLHLAYRIEVNRGLPVGIENLIKICYLFACRSEREDTFSTQLDILQKNNKKERKDELLWLIQELITNPKSLLALPLLNSLMVDEWKNQKNNITSASWWKPYGKNNFYKSTFKDFDWNSLLSALKECYHYFCHDEHFARHILFVFCYKLDDALKIVDFGFRWPKLILAWFAYRIENDAYFINGEECQTFYLLLKKVHEFISSSHYNANKLSHLTNIFNKLISILHKRVYFGIEKKYVKILLKLIDLADLIFTLYCHCGATTIEETTSKKFVDSLSGLLSTNEHCFQLAYEANAKEWQEYFELLRYKGNSPEITDVWVVVMSKSLKDLTKNRKCDQEWIVKFFCSSSFDVIDNRLQSVVETIATDYTKIVMKKEKVSVQKWFEQIQQECPNSSRFSQLVSQVFVRVWPDPNSTEFEIFIHLLKLPFLNRYFDKKFVSIAPLTEECEKYLTIAKDILTKYKNLCISLNINLQVLKTLKEHKAVFVQVLLTLDDDWEENDFSKFLENLFAIFGQFVDYQNQLKILSPFLDRIELKEKDHVSEIVSLRFEEIIFSKICRKNKDDSSLSFEWKLPDDLTKYVNLLEMLQNNNLFNHFWRETCSHTKNIHPDLDPTEESSDDVVAGGHLDSLVGDAKNHPIPLSNVVDKIYSPTVENVQKCVDLLKSGSILISEFEKLINALPNDAVSYLPNDVSVVCLSLLNKDDRWVQNFEEKLNLYAELKKYSTTNEVFLKLLENLKLQNALKDIKQLSLVVTGADCDLTLKDIHKNFIQGAKELKEIKEDQLECLAAVNECWDLIEWAREKDEKDLPRFVDIALTNVGESDADVAMITDFNNVIIGFNCLIFNVEKDLNLKNFIEQLKRLWSNLSRNPNLAKQLKQARLNRFKLDELWKASGDLEKTSLRQIENINRKGIYKIGNLQPTISKKTVENCIELEFTDEKEASVKVYSMTELRDLHSRVMLIGTQMGKEQTAKKEIEEFAEEFDGILRLASLYVKHYEAGNIFFIDWKCFLDNDTNKKRQASCCLTNNNSKLISGEKDENLTVYHQIDALCKFFEESLKEWNEYVEKMRDKFSELNYFTNRQIEFLRKSLARINKGLEHKAAAMLLVLDPDVTPTKIIETTVASINSTENEKKNKKETSLNDAETKFVEYLVDYGLDEELALAAAIHVKFSNRQEALSWASENMDFCQKNRRTSSTQAIISNLMRDASFAEQLNEMVENLQTKVQNLLASKLAALWSDHIKKNESTVNYAEFLGVHQLGCILREISAAASRRSTSKELKGIKMNEPNLILSPADELYRFVLSLYATVGDCLPSFDAVLMCSEETTVENLNLMIRRIKQNDGDVLFSLVDVDRLKSDVCIELEIILEDLKKCGRKFCLALIANEENFAKSPASNYLSRFTIKHKNPSTWVQSKSFILQHVLRKNDNTTTLNLAKISPEFCLTYFKAAFFTSVGYGHGKSRIISLQKRALPQATLVKIPVHDGNLVDDNFYPSLKQYLVDPSTKKQRIFHVDILNHRTMGVDKFLFQLFILGGFTTSDGDVWRLLPNDFYAIEMTSSPNRILSMKGNVEHLPAGIEFRFLLPTVLCHSPIGALHLALGELMDNQHVVNRSFDEDWLNDDSTQRCYQYLSMPPEKVEKFQYVSGKNDIAGADVLKVLLTNCGVADPSWSELKNFVNFLDPQLTACEHTPYCQAPELPGFKTFAVKFMTNMSRDFSTRSLKISEDVGSLVRDELNVIKGYQFQPKQKWEHKSHPYLFFNDDLSTFSFFGCNLTKHGNLIDASNGNVIQQGMAAPNLVFGLRSNGVDDLETKFDDKSRLKKIEKLCMVLGVEFYIDPDPAYEITSDCALKMLAIKMRFRCGIPVVIMGETGCGKTKLIEYLCDLERNYYLQPDIEVKPQNLIIVRIHGGTTKENIENEVLKAIDIAETNYQNFKLSTVLFFDEANATPAISLIKEIMCDGTMNGRDLNLQGKFLNVIAAVNPYRKHTEEMIKKLETSGLGYHVTVSKVTEKFGNIPLRQLVYRVHPLPASMLPMVWDFGTLSNETESLYIKQMVQRFVSESPSKFPADQNTVNVFADILTQAQIWMRVQKDEASFVSLRNVERALKITEWFHANKDLFFKNEKKIAQHTKATLSVLMAICVCYRCSIQSKRDEFDDAIVKRFIKPLALSQKSTGIIKREIKMCQETFLEDVELPANIAKNEALRENVFMMSLCIELRIPLFLIGKPGSSKSLAKTIVAENMVALSAKNRVYRSLKQVALVSFQCSPLATADGVETIFRQCARHQKDQNLQHYVAAAVFDEIGLAEDSPALPLKALHGLLETGCSIAGEELTDGHRVAFVGISNWSLDPAKMNRGIFVTRIDPSRKQLFVTARRICNEDDTRSAFVLMQDLIHPITEAYIKVCETQENSFYGLRDFYSLMKMIYEMAEDKNKKPNYRQVINAVRHNFSGQQNRKALRIFEAELASKFVVTEDVHISAAELIEENLTGNNKKQRLNRYLLILSENYAAMRLIKKVKELENAEIIFGSSFPQDLEYTQVCRNINKIKVCMDKGRTVILLNLEQLYESLYDLLNQAFIQCSGEYFVDLGLGTHRLKCHVHKNFRLVVVAEREDALKRFPLALLNRLEKHFVSTMENAEYYQKNVVDDLKDWANNFASFAENGHVTRQLHPADAFIGYYDDSATVIVGEICKTNGFKSDSRREEELLKLGKEMLIRSSTPDAVMRLRCTSLKNEMNELWQFYFKTQSHASFVQYLRNSVPLVDVDGSKILHQITTHSQLFSHNDNSMLAKCWNLNSDQVTIITVQIYNTEHEFQKRIRNVFQSATVSPQFLIVQCLAGDQNGKLIACCRYILENIIKTDEFKNSNINVFLLISLPRVTGGCFKGFPSIQWQCSHIDELSPHVNDIDDFTELIGKSVASLLDEFIRNKEQKSVNFNFIVKESLQVAASYVRDDTHRKLERLNLLQRFWNENGEFRDVVYIWLRDLLKEMEENWKNPSDWILDEAAKTGLIMEHRTYKQSLCKFIENLLIPLLSGLITVVDPGENLNLLMNATTTQSAWKSKLWLKLFSDKDFLKLQYNSNVFIKKSLDGLTSPRSEFNISANPKFSVQVPFFWLIKNGVDDLLGELYQTASVDDKQLLDQVHELMKQTLWGSVICQLPTSEFTNFAKCYVRDFVLSSYDVVNEEKLSELLMMWIAHLSKFDEGAKTHSPAITCAIVHRRVAKNMQLFIDIVDINSSIVDILFNAPEEFSKFFYCLDLLSVDKLLKFMDELMEDIDAGAKMNILSKHQKENRLKFVSMVKSASTIVKTVFKSYEGQNGENSHVNQLLLRLKTDWFAAELCASFLYHSDGNTFPLKVKALWKENKENIEGFNSVKFWKGLETLMKIWTRQLFSFYFKSAALKCVYCELDASIRPKVLPCMHIVHEKCFKDVFQDMGVKVCPECNETVPTDIENETDKELHSKIDQYMSDRAGLTNFFLDLVCQLFNADVPPSIDVLKILLSYVTYESEDGHIKKTSEISPFPDSDAIDTNPVIRSFLLQLILNQNLSFVFEHINEYLHNGRLHLNTNQSITEFFWMCICCTEDSFYWKSVRACGFGLETTTINFISQNIPMPLEEKKLTDFTARHIEKVAKCRFVLSAFADIVGKSENVVDPEKFNDLNNLVRRFITDCKDKNVKFLLLKLICLRFGVECARKTLSNETFQWIVSDIPLGDADAPDPFVIYRDSYTTLKDAVYETVFQNNLKVLEQTLQAVHASDRDLTNFYLTLALQQWLKSTKDQTLAEEQRKILNLITERFVSGSLKEICFDKLIAQSYWTTLIDECQSMVIASFAFHLRATIFYLPATGVVTFFRLLLSTPDQIQDLLFPAMPDHDFDQAMFNVLTQTVGASVNECPNGHPYVIGDCGKPTTVSTCPECRCPIGGLKYAYSAGNVRLTGAQDKTKRGHCLGDITKMGVDVVPERNLDRISVATCRFLVHCTMWMSSLDDPNVEKSVAALTNPPVDAGQIRKFCFDHLNRDLILLSRLLSVSRESVVNLMHKLLNVWVVNKQGGNVVSDLTTKDGRRLWEEYFRQEILSPILTNSEALIAECDTQIANDGTQNKFYAQIYEPVRPADPWSLFWSYRPPSSFESLLAKILSQLDSNEEKKFIIMGEFLKRISFLNACQYLQSIVSLHKEMRSRLGSLVNLSEIRQMTIKQFLSEQSDGAKLKPLIDAFFSALKIVEPKLNNFKFSLKSREKLKDETKFVPRIVVIENWMVPNLNDPLNNSLTSILPLAFEQGFCSCAVVDLLIREQNEFTMFCINIYGESDQIPFKHLDEATSGQLISFDADRDIYPLLMLHRNFSYNLETKTDSFFDLTRLHQRLERFYAKDFVLYQYYVPLLKTRESLLFDCLKRLRSKKDVKNDLTMSQKRAILKILIGKTSETRILLDLVEMMIRFSASVDRYDEQLIEFSQRIHCLPTEPCLLKILNGLSLAHLPSLWQLIAFHSKWLILINSEDPFIEIDEKFKTELVNGEAEILLNDLRNVDLLQFLLETTELLLLYLSFGASGLDRLRVLDEESNAQREIYDDEFESYLLDRDECQLQNVGFDGCLKLKHSIDIWKHSAKFFAQNRKIE